MAKSQYLRVGQLKTSKKGNQYMELSCLNLKAFIEALQEFGEKKLAGLSEEDLKNYKTCPKLMLAMFDNDKLDFVDKDICLNLTDYLND